MSKSSTTQPTKSERMTSYVPEDIEKGAFQSGPFSATSKLHQQARELRTLNIPWASYKQLNILTESEIEFISSLDSATDCRSRSAIIERQPELFGRTFISIVQQVSKEETVAYAINLLDDLFQEDKSRVDTFKRMSSSQSSAVDPLLQILNRSHLFTIHITGRVLAKIACWSAEPMADPDLKFFLAWIKDQLRVQGNEYMQSVCRCLQMLLRVDHHRKLFFEMDGVTSLMNLLVTRLPFQLQYQLGFCLWVLSFNPDIAAKIGSSSRVIPIMADILADAQKEKVSRIILALFVNLLEKPSQASAVKENSIAMVQCKVLKQLEYLEHKKFEDEDILNDIEFLKERMDKAILELSSFDEYVTELHSGWLEWSPVHRSELFWRENVTRFNDGNYQLLKALIAILQNADDPLVLSVACFDIGEYVRHYARGKHLVEQLGGKTRVMALLGHADPNVRYEALLAVQKLMVHNWEYLGRQLEKEQGKKSFEHPIKAR